MRKLHKIARIYQLYQKLSEKYRDKKFWSKWCKRRKTNQDKEEIALGAILTQRTKWENVEISLENLRKAKVLSIGGIYLIAKKDIRKLETLIKPSGFYKQKAKRLFYFSKFIVENYNSLKNFFHQDLKIAREMLLKLYGIGRETADTILLYAGQKPIFVIDEYTKRFVKKYNISDNLSYEHLRNLFEENLPRDIKIYQDFHAMIVLDGKR